MTLRAVSFTPVRFHLLYLFISLNLLLGEDYEESHGKFVPDKDLPDWLARNTSTYKKLIKMRADCREFSALGGCALPPTLTFFLLGGLSVVESAAKFEAYFNAGEFASVNLFIGD